MPAEQALPILLSLLVLAAVPALLALLALALLTLSALLALFTFACAAGGGLRCFRRGAAVFDETGGLQPDIRFPTLAAHIWFSEMAQPWNPTATPSPFLGALGGKGIALLYNGILGDKSVNGGNVLNRQTLRVIREASGGFVGPITIYGERTVLSEASLEAENLIFKQTPYDVRARK